MRIPRYIVLNKKIGETPLSCAEAWRAAQPPAMRHLPLSYAGRLDPMASGKLLVLIGDECKVQEKYHALDKRYEFSVLLGVSSDTGDVLGRLMNFNASPPPSAPVPSIKKITTTLTGPISLPFPHFSAKTVKGKPLHVWTLEGRLHEITIPTQTSTIYKLTCTRVETLTREQIYHDALKKINAIPPVTDERKALGNDFRRVDIRADWQKFYDTGNQNDRFTIINCACICSSGTYMRSLAEEIGRRLGNVPALAYHIHRTHIGKYFPITTSLGFWYTQY